MINVSGSEIFSRIQSCIRGFAWCQGHESHLGGSLRPQSRRKNKWIRHIFAASVLMKSIWIFHNSKQKCPTKRRFFGLLCLFPGFHLNYPSIFSTLLGEFMDFWSFCGKKKGSKTRQINSKSLSSFSYHDVKLKQFITVLEPKKMKDLTLDFDCLQFFCFH